MASTCALCLLSLLIYVSPDGACVAIVERASGAVHPCTAEIMRDTGCWDGEGRGQLCGASLVELRGSYRRLLR